MTLEAWDIKYKPNLDWNHAWGTAPVNIVARHLWGITPSKPGFAKAAIKPQPGALTFSKIKVPTIKGPIFAEYKQIGRNIRLFIIKIPNGMTGEFIITDGPHTRIIKNNQVVKSNKDRLQLSAGVTRIRIEN
jgi:alpha-L-rhamnosidase